MQSTSTLDRECFDAVLAVPWLKDSVAPTGVKWGTRVADVEMSRLPTFLLGQVMLIPSDESHCLTDEVRLVVYRWDRYDHLGWKEPFVVTLKFPDGSRYEIEVPPSFGLVDGHSVRIPVGPTTVVRERVQQVARNIPRIIFNLSAPVTKQISQDVRRLLKNVRRMTNLMQCTCLYLVLEDEACRKEVEASGIPNFVEAYNALRAPSFKADLVRYYLLYKYGGVYLDDKTLIRQSLDSPVFDSIFAGEGSSREGPCDLFICSHITPEIAFMGARKGSPIMLKALEAAIECVMRRDYTNHRLGITGNIMFHQMMQDGKASEDIEPSSLSFESIALRAKRGDYYGQKVVILPITLSDERIMYGDDILWQRQAIPSADWPKPTTYYANLWNQNLVYTDGNPPPRIARMSISAETKREIIAYSCTIFAILCFGFLIAQYPPIIWI